MVSICWLGHIFVVLGVDFEASGVKLSKAHKECFNITCGIYSCMVEPAYYLS